MTERASATDRLGRGRHAGGRDHRPAEGRGSAPCRRRLSAATTRLRSTQRGLDKLELALPQRRSRARRIWFAVWPKLAAVGLFFFIWQCIVGAGGSPSTCSLARTGARTARHRLRASIREAAVRTLQRALGRVPARGRHRHGDRGRGRAGARAAQCGRFDDHRATDHAVDRVVPAGHHPVPAHRRCDPVRRRAGRRPVDRERAHRRHRHDPADHAADRSRARRAGACHVPPRHHACGVARPSSAGSSRVGRSPGAASSPASCSCSSRASFSLGQRLQFAAEFADSEGVLAAMIVIFFVGVVVDALFFAQAERWVRRRYGLVDAATGR